MESTSAAMERTFVAVSGPDSTCMTGEDEIAGARVMAEDCVSAGAGLLMSGCVCCILTVAFGSAGLPGVAPSGGRVMRAVSFFGAAGLSGTVPAGGGGIGGLGTVPLGAGAGFSGTVARAPLSEGGFGGGCTPLAGFAGGSGIPAWEGGRGGGGAKGGPGGRGAAGADGAGGGARGAA